MTAKYDPAEVERLVREAKEDDAALRAPAPGCSCNGAAFCEDWCPAYPWAVAQSAATQRSEANLAAMADQLEAARDEIARLRAEVETLRCYDLVPYIDGELDSARTEAFQLHLATCETCQRESLAHIQLSARLSGLGDPE